MPLTTDLARSSQWVITKDALPLIAQVARGKLTEAEVRAELEGDSSERIAGTTQGQVAVVPLQGIITPYGTLFSILRGTGGGLQA